MSLEWSGSLTDGDDIIKGTIKIPNLSEENEPEDITVSLSDIFWRKTRLESLRNVQGSWKYSCHFARVDF